MSLDLPIQMQIYSSPAHLQIVRAALEKLCEHLGFDEPTTHRIVLGVDEALTNIIRHAYDGDEQQRIDIDLSPLGAGGREGLRIRLRDYGKAVDPSRIRSRDLSDVRPGGLGVHIMNTCLDSVEYRPAEGSGTELTLVKHLPSGKPQP